MTDGPEHGETSEETRIRGVYAGYQRNGLAARKWSETNRGNQAIIAERNRTTIALLAANGFWPLRSTTILDIGCGTGKVLLQFLSWGAETRNLKGIDLLSERIRQARQLCPGCDLQAANAERLPFKDSCFDLVSASTVFSSILDPSMARNISNEIIRVLKPGGAVLWYDLRFDNPFNRNVRGLNGARIRTLFPGLMPTLVAITLLPPVSRRLGVLTRLLYPLLCCPPFLRSHYLGLLRKPRA